MAAEPVGAVTSAPGPPGAVLESSGLTTAAVRALLSTGSAVTGGGGLPEHVAERLGEAIRLGLLRDGERLPPEARLAEHLGVSTVTLREALAILRSSGQVVTRRGRGGGSFLRSPGAARSQRLREFTAIDLRDIADERCAVSGTSARLAAQRADDAELEGLLRRLERLTVAISDGDRGRADAQLAIQIASAAQSPRLAHQEARLRAELGDLLWAGLDARDRARCLAQRSGLVQAVRQRDAQASQQCAEQLVRADLAGLLAARLDVISQPRRARGTR